MTAAVAQDPPRRRLGAQARRLALEMYAETRAEWRYATDVMAQGFRAHREIGSGFRRLCAETVYGLIRQHRRLEAIVGELLESARVAPVDVPPHVRDELLLLVHE